MSFIVDIDDDCALLPSAAELAPSITADAVNGRVQVSIVSHFAISNGHGVFYANINDVPSNRMAFYDIPSRTLTLIGEL